jgi:peptidoglycan/xylan/chitin deacetylase (PgdA/CDA1 family)
MGNTMLEAAISILAIALFAGAGLAFWRLTCGPSRGWPSLVLRAAILALVSALLTVASAWELSNSRTFQLFGGIVYRVNTSVPVVALTFDDGPSPRFTEDILSVLREQQAKATFFVTGQGIEENAEAARRIVEEGHELGNHSTSHRRMILKPYSFIQQEIEGADHLIRAAGYEGDIHFRSPYGKKLILLPYYLRTTGRLNIFWDVEPESYGDVAVDADCIVDHVLARARPGSIILLHVMAEGRAESRKALPDIIRGLKEQGYRLVTVSELLALR